MSLTNEEVQKIASLSRLNLSEVEIAEYGPQLDSVFQYFEQLKEVNIDGVNSTAQVGKLNNALREDAVNETDEEIIKYALKQGEITAENFIKVKKVL